LLLIIVVYSVSGGVKGAELGTLTFMVGAKSKADFEAIKPFLECMGVSDFCFFYNFKNYILIFKIRKILFILVKLVTAWLVKNQKIIFFLFLILNKIRLLKFVII
jgi:hypothetical protein